MRGESVAKGYWNKPELTQTIFEARLSDGEGPFLRTGDLGIQKEGNLYVIGRLKNMIIIRGRNLFPHDIEMAMERCHPALNGCNGAAFTVTMDAEEKLVVVHEVDRIAYRSADSNDIILKIRKAITDEFQVDVFAILLVKPGTLPITEQCCDEVLSLPVFPELNNEQLQRVVQAVNDFLPEPENHDETLRFQGG